MTERFIICLETISSEGLSINVLSIVPNPIKCEVQRFFLLLFLFIPYTLLFEFFLLSFNK